MLVGPPKVGKSYLAFQVALAVAQGRQFMGRATRKGRVLFLQFDTPDHIWRERLDELADAGVDLGGDIHFVRPETALRQVDIRLENTRKELEDIIKKVDPDLVIIDVLRKIHNGDENDSREGKVIFDILNVVCEGRSLFILHHMRKPNGDYVPTPSTAGRGTSFYGGEVDATWLILADRKGETARFMIESRVDESIDTMLVRDPDSGLWVFTEEAELRDQSDKLIALCDEFPGQSHNQLYPLLKQRGIHLSKSQYYKKMKGLRCRHSPMLIAASSGLSENEYTHSDEQSFESELSPQTSDAPAPETQPSPVQVASM